MFPLVIGALVIVALLVSRSETPTRGPIAESPPPAPPVGPVSSKPPPVLPTPPPRLHVYRVVSGDSASVIGQKYNKGGVYGEIFAANPSKAIVRVYMNNDVGHEGEFFTTPDVDQVWSLGNKPTFTGRNFAKLDVGEMLNLPLSW